MPRYIPEFPSEKDKQLLVDICKNAAGGAVGDAPSPPGGRVGGHLKQCFAEQGGARHAWASLVGSSGS